MARYRAYFNKRQPFLKRVAGPLFCALVLFYLGFHAVSGERGVLALIKENRKLEMLKAELSEVAGKRQSLEAKVHGLSSNSLDLDLLDEQVRRVLGMTGKNEVIYFLGTAQK